MAGIRIMAWQVSSSSLDRPELSRPNSTAAPAPAWSVICAAAVWGVTSGQAMLRVRGAGSEHQFAIGYRLFKLRKYRCPGPGCRPRPRPWPCTPRWESAAGPPAPVDPGPWFSWPWPQRRYYPGGLYLPDNLTFSRSKWGQAAQCTRMLKIKGSGSDLLDCFSFYHKGRAPQPRPAPASHSGRQCVCACCIHVIDSPVHVVETLVYQGDRVIKAIIR